MNSRLKLFLVLVLSCYSILVYAGGTTNHKPPHLDIEATSQELRSYLLGQEHLQKTFRLSAYNVKSADPLERALALGEKLFGWLEKINEVRSPENKIRLSSPKDRKGIPITEPSRYSPKIIGERINNELQLLPPAMSDVLLGKSGATSELPVSVEEFIKHGRELDRIYQSAARWNALIPYKNFYIARQQNDIRGYYFLSTEKWNSETLKNWPKLNDEVRSKIRGALEGICMNAGQIRMVCRQAVENANDAERVIALYNEYVAAGQEIYDSFFDIHNPRKDIQWDRKNEAVMSIPFYKPDDAGVQNFIKGNLEDEFQWKGWGMKINFINSRPAPYIVFVPGVTANVEYLGGDKITMDANKSISEYEEQWTIRHEFGHVLGLPDCYHEFYDSQNEEFINYQIDITDLMCSRAGNISARIVEQLKSQYMR